MKSVLTFVAFYASWFACVVGAARGHTALGPIVVAACLLVHLRFARQPAHEAVLILTVGLLGWLVDTGQAIAGVFTFPATSPLPWACPPWLVAIWMIFASTLNGPMRWMGGRPVVAALLGALGGPVSYFYGAQLGAITLHADVSVSLTALALVWAAVMPAMCWLARAIVPPDEAMAQPATLAPSFS